MVPTFNPGEKLRGNMRLGNNPNKEVRVFEVIERLPDNYHYHVYRVQVLGEQDHRLMSVDRQTGVPALHGHGYWEA